MTERTVSGTALVAGLAAVCGTMLLIALDWKAVQPLGWLALANALVTLMLAIEVIRLRREGDAQRGAAGGNASTAGRPETP